MKSDNVNAKTCNVRSLTFGNDFDIAIFQNLLGSFQRNIVGFSKHLINGTKMTQKCPEYAENRLKMVEDFMQSSSDTSKMDGDDIVRSMNNGSQLSNNYADELLGIIKRIKKCLFGMCEKMLCLLDMSTKLHLYDYTAEEIELLQKNLSFLYSTFKPVHDHLNSKMDSIAEVKDEYIDIEKSIADQAVWLKDAINIFSIEVMSISDENEIFEFMEKKSKYQQELSECCEITRKLDKRIETIECFDADLRSKLNSLKEGQEELTKLSYSQDQRFENDMEKEDEFYEKVEEYITWIGNIKEGTDDNEDIAVIFANHNALVKDIETKAKDLTFLNSLGKDLLDFASTEDRHLSFSNQLEEIRLEWNQLLEQMTEKEILLANIYKVRPRSFAKMLVAKSQLEVEAKSVSPPIRIVLTNVAEEYDNSSSLSISQQDATKGDSDDTCADSLLDWQSIQSITLDSSEKTNTPESYPIDSLDIVNLPGKEIVQEENDGTNGLGECKKPTVSETVCNEHQDLIIKGNGISTEKYVLSDFQPEPKVTNNVDVMATGRRYASSLQDFSNDMIQTSQKNDDESNDNSQDLEDSSINNINIKLKLDIQTDIDEEGKDLETEAIVFYVEDVLLQIGNTLSQSDDNIESVEMRVLAITKNINSLLQLSSDLQQSLLKLEKIENVHYAALIGNLTKRVTGILEFLEPYIDALTDDLEKLNSLVSLYEEYSNSVNEYNENLDAMENLIISELELSDSFVGFKAVLDTAMNQMKSQAKKLGEVISAIKKNVHKLPSKEKLTLKKCVDNAINKTNELEKIVIDSKLEVDLLISEFGSVEEKLKPIKRWVNKTKNIIRMSNLDMREKINEKCVEYTASIYDLFKYSSTFLDRLPKIDQNNLQMRFEMLFKSLKDIKTLLDTTPIGEDSHGQTNSKGIFLSMLTICTANTRFLLDNASDAAIENESDINIDQFLMEMKFLEENTCEITSQFGEYLHYFKKSELKSTSCDLINMLEQQVLIKTLLHDVDVQQSEKLLNGLLINETPHHKSNNMDNETSQYLHLQNTFQNAKLMLLILYKHQSDIGNLNKEICLLPNLLVDAFTKKDLYANTINKYQDLFKHICDCQSKISVHLSQIENKEFNNVIDAVREEYIRIKEALDVYFEFLNFAQEIKLEVGVMIDVATRTIEEIKQQLLNIKLVRTVSIKFELLTPIMETLNNLIKQGKSVRNVNLQLLPTVDKEQIDYILWKLRIKVNRLFESVNRTRKHCELVKLQKVINTNIIPYLFAERKRCEMNFYPHCMSQLNLKITFIFYRMFSHGNNSIDPHMLIQLLVSNLKLYTNVNKRKINDNNKQGVDLYVKDKNILNNNLMIHPDWQCNKKSSNTENIRTVKMFSTTVNGMLVSIEKEPMKSTCNRKKDISYHINIDYELGLDMTLRKINTRDVLLNQKPWDIANIDWMFGVQDTRAITAGQYFATDVPNVQYLQYLTGKEIKYNIEEFEKYIFLPQNFKSMITDLNNIPLIQPYHILQNTVTVDPLMVTTNFIEDNIHQFPKRYCTDDFHFASVNKNNVVPIIIWTDTFASNHLLRFVHDKTLPYMCMQTSKLNVPCDWLFSEKSGLDYQRYRWCIDYLEDCINELNNHMNFDRFFIEKRILNDLNDRHNKYNLNFDLQDDACYPGQKYAQFEQWDTNYFLSSWQLLNRKELETWQNAFCVWDKNDCCQGYKYESAEKDEMSFKMLFREIEDQTKEKQITKDDFNDDIDIKVNRADLFKEQNQEAIYHLSQIERAIGSCSYNSLSEKIYHMEPNIAILGFPRLEDVTTNLSSYFEKAVCMMANLSRNNMMQIGESRFRRICPPTQIISILYDRSDIFNLILPVAGHCEDIGNNLLVPYQKLYNGNLLETLPDILRNKSITLNDNSVSHFHKICASPDLSEGTETYEWDDNDITAEPPFSFTEDYCFTLDDLKCDDLTDSTTSSESGDLGTSNDIQTAVISILEDAVLQLNEYEKLEIGYKEFKSMDDAVEITDGLNFNEAQSELIKCEVLILSLKDQIPDMELDELLEETAILQKYFSDTCDDLVKWKRKLCNLRSLQYDYEIGLYSLLCKLTSFRERVIENAKISLNSISKQLTVDKQTLFKLKEEVNHIKQNRINIEKRLPDPVKEELRMMEMEFNEELNAMFCNVYKEEAYAKELMTNKINLSQSISKISYTLRLFQEHFKEIVQSEKTNSFEDLKKIMQDLVKINDDWEHDKNEIKKLILMLPHEDIKNIETSNIHITAIFRYIQDQLKNNPMLINYFLDIDKRLSVWAQKFSSIESMQKYDQTLMLQEQLRINGILMSLVNEYSSELSNIFKDIEITFSLNIIGYTNNDKQEKMKLCATSYQNNIKEVESFIREKINNLTESQCNLEYWFTQQKELESKINTLIADHDEVIDDKAKQLLLIEIYNDYYGLTYQFDEIKMQLPMGNLISVQQCISYLRSRINQLKEKENIDDLDDDHSTTSTSSVIDDYQILDFEDGELQYRGFGDFGQFGDVNYGKKLVEEEMTLSSFSRCFYSKTFDDYYKDLNTLVMRNNIYNEGPKFGFNCLHPSSNKNKICKLNSAEHKILSLHSFHMEGVRESFVLSESAALKLWSEIVYACENHKRMLLSKFNFSQLTIASVKNANKIFISCHENTNNLQEMINLHPNSNKEMLIMSNSSFDETNPLQFDDLCHFKSDDYLIIDIHHVSGKYVFY